MFLPLSGGSLPPAWKHFCSGAGAGPADSRAVGKGAETFLSGDTGTGLGLPLLCHCQPLALGYDVTLFKGPGEKESQGICFLQPSSKGRN